MSEESLIVTGARAAFFITESLVILFIAKVARDSLSLARGYRVREILTVKDNVAAAIDVSGYLLAVILGLLDSLSVGSTSLLGQASDVAFHGLLVVGCLLLADWIADKAIFRNLDDHKEIYEHANVALAVGRAGAAIATGLVIRGAFGDPNTPLVFCLLWVGVGQAAMVVIALVYQRFTPYDDLAEIGRNNLAAGLPIAGILIAVGTTVGAGVTGEVSDVSKDLVAVLLYLATSVVMIWLLRTLTGRLLLGGARLSDEITKDRNVGAGLIEAMSFVIGGFLVAFYLN